MMADKEKEGNKSIFTWKSVVFGSIGTLAAIIGARYLFGRPSTVESPVLNPIIDNATPEEAHQANTPNADPSYLDSSVTQFPLDLSLLPAPGGTITIFGRTWTCSPPITYAEPANTALELLASMGEKPEEFLTKQHVVLQTTPHNIFATLVRDNNDPNKYYYTQMSPEDGGARVCH